MLHLRLFFDAGHPDAQAAFAQWPDLLAGLSVACDYLPVQASGHADGEALLLRAWERSHRGLSPGRWSCTLLIHEMQGLPPTPVPPLRQHASDDPLVQAALAAARAKLAASAHVQEVRAHGLMLQVHTQWWAGMAGVKAWRAALESSR